MKQSIFSHGETRPDEMDGFETLYPTSERPAKNSVTAFQRHKCPELLRHIIT